MYFNIFQALFKSDAKFDEFIRNPTVARSLKKDAIDAVMTKKKASPVTKNFFCKQLDQTWEVWLSHKKFLPIDFFHFVEVYLIQ